MEKSMVLVVEDEPLLRMVAVEVLSDAGYVVLEAGDGIEALEILQTSVVDLLMTDIQMPRMNGYQLVEAAIERWPKMKILLVTGYARDSVPPSVLKAGLQTLQKPFEVDGLPKIVSNLLKD
jgi:CheY-like chemotaxis protein